MPDADGARRAERCPDRRGAEKFARSLPNGRWVRIEKSGHNVQGDNPRAFLDAMATFLSRSWRFLNRLRT